MRTDLKRLKKERESGGAAGMSSDSHAMAVATGTNLGLRAGEGDAMRSNSSVLMAAVEHKWGFWTAAIVILALIAGAGYGTYAFLTRGKALPFQDFTATTVGGSAGTRMAAISADGKYVLSLKIEKGMGSLWLRHLPSNSNTQVISPTPDNFQELLFSPDSNYFYFVKGEKNKETTTSLFRAPILGGTPEKVLSGPGSEISFSPDGQEFVYVSANDSGQGHWRLMIHNLKAGTERIQLEGTLDESFEMPAWSPKGNVIVGVSSEKDSGVNTLVALDLKSGAKTVFYRSKKNYLYNPKWLPNGKGLLVLAYQEEANSKILYVSYPGGESYPVTRDAASYTGLSLSADGGTIATVSENWREKLFVIRAQEQKSGEAKEITADRGFKGLTWTAQGQLVIADGGDFILIGSNLDQKTLLQNQDGAFSLSSCDKKQIIVFSAPNGADSNRIGLWRMNAEGGELKRLTNGKMDWLAACAHSSPWIIYWDFTAQKMKRISLEGGAPEREYEQIPTPGGVAISPDDKLVAFATDDPKDHRIRLGLFDPISGHTERMMDFQRPIKSQSPLQFTPNAKAVVYVTTENDVDNLWYQPIDGSSGRWLTTFDGEHIAMFRWSPDWSKLAVIRGHTDDDIVLIRDTGTSHK